MTRRVVITHRPASGGYAADYLIGTIADNPRDSMALMDFRTLAVINDIDAITPEEWAELKRIVECDDNTAIDEWLRTLKQRGLRPFPSRCERGSSEGG